MQKIIYLQQLRLLQSVGIHDFERLAPQPYLIDIELHVQSSYITREDNIKEAIDYDAVRNGVKEHLGSRHFDLQETIAQDILRICFIADSRITHVRVRTAKTDVYPDCAAVGLDYFLGREELIHGEDTQ
jgi:dihydroneopterin aldolase